MPVNRITLNIATIALPDTRKFYMDMFDLDIAMDIGWITTLETGRLSPTQISIATEGGAGTPVPDISIEVSDVDAIYARAIKRGHSISYGPTTEPWGVRRFYLRNPAGKLLNILSHI